MNIALTKCMLYCTNFGISKIQIVCVCVCVFLFVFTSVHREGYICLEQLECRGTDQQWCVDDVSFLCQVPSLLLKNEAPSLYN